jgi:hypothetical protein
MAGAPSPACDRAEWVFATAHDLDVQDLVGAPQSLFSRSNALSLSRPSTVVNSRANGASDSRPNEASAKWLFMVSNRLAF